MQGLIGQMEGVRMVDVSNWGLTLSSSSSPSRMFRIATMSVRVDGREDRLRFDVREVAGTVEGIWLTQRLANKLIQAIAADLDRDILAGLASPMGVDDGLSLQTAHDAAQPEITDSQRQQAQQRTRLERLKKLSPQASTAEAQPKEVEQPQASRCWLCTTIRLETFAGGVNLILTDDVSVSAVFSLTFENGRGLLDCLVDHYRMAGWSLQYFPAWMFDSLTGRDKHIGERVLN